MEADGDVVEVFVIDETQTITSEGGDAPSPDEAAGFVVHRPDQPPEEGGPLWIVEEASPEERAALQVALEEGLVAEVSAHVLDSEPINPGELPEIPHS